MQRNLQLTTIIATILLMVGAGFFANLTPWRSVRTTVTRTACSPNEICVASMSDNRQISIKLKPTYLPVVTPLEIEVHTLGLEVKNLTLSISGVDYYMGENRPIMRCTAPNTFVGRTIFPAPIEQSTRWIVMIVAHTWEGEILAPFEFNLTQRHIDESTR